MYTCGRRPAFIHYAHTHTHAHISMRTHIYTHIHIRMHTHAYTSTHTHTDRRTHARAHTHARTHTHTHTPLELVLFILMMLFCCDSAGAPRVLHTDIRLPIRLVVKPCFPVKNANFRITIDTNKPPVNLNDLFPGQYTHSCLSDIMVTFTGIGHLPVAETGNNRSILQCISNSSTKLLHQTKCYTICELVVIGWLQPTVQWFKCISILIYLIIC